MGAVFGVIRDAIDEAAEFIANTVRKAVDAIMKRVFNFCGLVVRLFHVAEKAVARAFADGTEVGAKTFDKHNIEDVARLFDEVERRLG